MHKRPPNSLALAAPQGAGHSPSQGVRPSHIWWSHRNQRVSLLFRKLFKSSPFSVVHLNLFILFLFLWEINIASSLGHFLLLLWLPTSSSYCWYSSNKWNAKAFLIHLELHLSPYSSIHWRYFSSKNLALSTLILWCNSLININLKYTYFLPRKQTIIYNYLSWLFLKFGCFPECSNHCGFLSLLQ